MQPMLDQIRADAAQRAGVAPDQVKMLTRRIGHLGRRFARMSRSPG